MGLRGALATLARDAPAQVFSVFGRGGRVSVDTLRGDDRLHFVDSPRSATVLLVAGELPRALHGAALAVHDAMPHPRATVQWTLEPGLADGSAGFDGVAVSGDGDAVIRALVDAHHRLVLGRQASEPDLLPDADPAPWRGVGPYGQGGKGMTGGVPFGRPMADRAPDRDGLELDQLSVAVGPFFPAFPPGLVLEVRLQGDVIQSLTLGANPFEPMPPGRSPRAAVERVFQIALDEPVPVAALELARARHHLRWLAFALTIQGLGSLGRRVRRLAATVNTAGSDDVQSLGRFLERTRAFGWATAGVGVTGRDTLQGMPGGPVSRAAGIPSDARSTDPAYLELGFEPVVTHGADARARWRQRLAEAAQSVELARRAGGRFSTPTGEIESPWGTRSHTTSPSASMLALLPLLLAEMEWGDAVTTLVSLDIDLEEAAGSEARV